MADVTIVVQNGGEASVNDNITWQNSGAQRIQVTGLEGICSASGFHVPPAAGGKNGEHSGVTVLPNAPAGDHTYSYVPKLNQTNAVLKINTSMPK